MKKLFAIIISICVLLSFSSLFVSADTPLYFGDVNKDGEEVIGAEDLQSLVDILIEKADDNDMSDINEDETTNILDLVALKKLIVAQADSVEIAQGNYTDIVDSNN